jgi:Holliday junction resolvase
MLESTIKAQIMAHLKLLERGAFWRIAGGKFGVSGLPDILGVYRGLPVAFEVKTPERKSATTESQERFIEKYNNAGGYAYVVTSLREVQLILLDLNDILDGKRSD